jgi:hypothetical protein
MPPNEQEGAPMDVPEFYCDGTQIGLSPYTAILSLTKQPAGQDRTVPPIKVAIVRMSLEHAKVMSIILRKQLKNYEAQTGVEIQLPKDLYQQLGISKQEDW